MNDRVRSALCDVPKSAMQIANDLGIVHGYGAIRGALAYLVARGEARLVFRHGKRYVKATDEA